MDPIETLREALKQALITAPCTLEEGKKVYTVRAARGLLPFSFALSMADGKVSNHKAFLGDVPQIRAAGEPGTAPDGKEPSEDVIVTGTASSTSVDWYGTEMSQACLLDMTGQFASGVDVMPSHGGGFFGTPLSWDDTMGRTTAGDVSTAAVAEPADSVEQGWVLKVSMALDCDSEKVESLCKRLGKGQAIGLSIGGWFREVRYIRDDNGDLSRIVVESVELDHLAIVRNPANPDCMDLQVLRSTGVEWATDLKAKAPAPAAPAVEAAPAEPLHIAGEDDTDLDVRNACPFADLPLAPESTEWAWDTAAQDTVLGDPADWGRYKKAHVWFDAEKTAETKGKYKLPIGMMIDGNLKAVWNGVSAAMGALNGARGGVNIPAEDRRPVYNHLKRYYKKFGKEPPKLLSAEEADAFAASEPATVPIPEPPAEVPLATSGDAALSASNPPEVSPAPVLDTRGGAGENHTEASNEASPPQEKTMDPETTELLRSINAKLEAQAAELAELKARASAPPAPVTETPEAKCLRLEADLANRNQVIANLSSQSQRIGTRNASVDAPIQVKGLDALVSRCKDGEAVAVREVVAANKAHLTCSFRAKGAEGQKTREAAEASPDMLRSLLNAAVADGTMRDWYRAAQDSDLY